MLYAVIMIFVFSTGWNGSCGFGKTELVKVLDVLYSRNVLELSNCELNITAPSDYKKLLSGRVKLGNKIIKLSTGKLSDPSISFTIIKQEKDRSIKLLFVASEAGSRYRGEIHFDCINDDLVFQDIYYLSEID